MNKAPKKSILILVADEDENVRTFVTDILQNHGFKVIQAINGGAAIKVIEDHKVDVAILAHRMKPNDGFEVVKHILVKGYDVDTVILTDDATTDLLLLAGQYEVGQVIKKPIEPDRLTKVVRHMLRKRGKNPDAIGPENTVAYTPEELMKRAIALAAQNANAGMGGPFAAIVTDSAGHLLGEGVNGVQLRCDPTAHAEVLAIRRATEKLGKPRLDGCILYCSTEPTMLGQALIIGTGIEKVYYGISHIESGTPRAKDQNILEEISKPVTQRTVTYEQLRRDDALAVFNQWQEKKASASSH